MKNYKAIILSLLIALPMGSFAHASNCATTYGKLIESLESAGIRDHYPKNLRNLVTGYWKTSKKDDLPYKITSKGKKFYILVPYAGLQQIPVEICPTGDGKLDINTSYGVIKARVRKSNSRMVRMNGIITGRYKKVSFAKLPKAFQRAFKPNLRLSANY